MKSELHKSSRTAGKHRQPMEYAQQISRAVCQEFKRIRKKKGPACQDVATKAGLSRAMIPHMETGFRNPTLMVAYSVAEALEVSLVNILKKIEKEQQQKD